MNTNDMFRKFSSSVDNNFLGFGGSDNLDKLAETLHKKWIDGNGDSPASEAKYIKMTKQYFIHPFLRKRAFVHYDCTIGGQSATLLTGGNATISYGVGIDFYKNVAMFGNANVFAYMLTKGFKFNSLSDLIDKPMAKALDDFLDEYKQTQQCNIPHETLLQRKSEANNSSLICALGIAVCARHGACRQ